MPIGPGSLLLILIVALLVFGPKRLPEIGRAAGKSLKEFKEATKGLAEEEEPPKKEEDEPKIDGMTLGCDRYEK